jgi:hypothetical protein
VGNRVDIPSDHYVEHEAVLAEYLREAAAPEVMDSDKRTPLGMSPNAPDSGFGFLSPVPDSGVGMRPVLNVPPAFNHGSMIDSNHPQVTQRGFAWVAQLPRLAPYDEG